MILSFFPSLSIYIYLYTYLFVYVYLYTYTYYVYIHIYKPMCMIISQNDFLIVFLLTDSKNIKIRNV